MDVKFGAPVSKVTRAEKQATENSYNLAIGLEDQHVIFMKTL